MPKLTIPARVFGDARTQHRKDRAGFKAHDSAIKESVMKQEESKGSPVSESLAAWGAPAVYRSDRKITDADNAALDSMREELVRLRVLKPLRERPNRSHDQSKAAEACGLTKLAELFDEARSADDELGHGNPEVIKFRWNEPHAVDQGQN